MTSLQTLPPTTRGLHQLDASSCNILKESSTFLSEPAAPAYEQQPPGQVGEGTPTIAVTTLVLPQHASQVANMTWR